MLRTAEAKARELGFSRMIVGTADIQRAAFRFYTKSMFRLRSEIAEAMTVPVSLPTSQVSHGVNADWGRIDFGRGQHRR